MACARTLGYANLLRGSIVLLIILMIYIVFPPTHDESCPVKMQLDQSFLPSPFNLHSSIPNQSRTAAKFVQLSKVYSNLDQIKDLRPDFKGLTYLQILSKISSSDKVVVLALIDGAFIQMAVNFYITSLAVHDITNYLMLATDYATCDKLLRAGIHCHVYRLDKAAAEASLYLSTSFLRKMNLRTSMILEALKAGFKVLHTDIDIYYSKNPMLYLEEECGTDCDIIALKDGESYNAGFVFIKPTELGIAVYSDMQKMVDSNTTKDDQTQLNNAIAAQHKKSWHFKPRFFPTEKYQCGKCFFEDTKRFFVVDTLMSPCNDCVVIHNNWIVSMEAKVYRAKELHHWMYDGEKYYSSNDRKYIMYNNPLMGKYSLAQEQQALQNALAFGQILNRTVILPKFHCSCSYCAANSVILLKALDKYFNNKYREHSFLLHPIVPSDVKQSVHGPIFIANDYIENNVNEKELKHLNKQYKTIQTNNTKGLSEEDVLHHYGSKKDSILHFVHMYQTFAGFDNEQTQSEFDERVRVGLINGGYRQFS